MSSTVADVRSAVGQISKGKDANADAWMAMWCSTNWGELLQPAPLSIALLGSLMVIASSVNDFSLIDVCKGTPIELKYVKHPDSFKTCLQQMAGAGLDAFVTASKSMTSINNSSSQLPGRIRNAVEIIIQNPSPEEFEVMLPIELDAIEELTKTCVDAATLAEEAFKAISALAQEMLECATYRAGNAQQQKARSAILVDILEKQKLQQEQMVIEAKETSDLMKRSYVDAEERFKSALDKIPSGMEIIGMHVVESLTSTLTGAVNSVLGTANLRGQFLQGIQSRMSGGSAVPENSTLPSGATLSDPGTTIANETLVLARSLELLISGGSGGKPDWNNIRGSGQKSGAIFVEMSLETTKARLDSKKPISAELLPIIDKGILTAKSIYATAASPDGTKDDALDEHKPVVKKMIDDLMSIVTRCNLILQQTGNPTTGFANPTVPQNITDGTSAAKTAVEIEKFKADQMRAGLHAARDSYDQASTRLIEGQREVAKTIGELTKLKLETAKLEEIIPVLVNAVKTFSTLRAQFAQMLIFFSNVASLVNDVMRPQVTTWAKKVQAGANLILSGVRLSDFMRNSIYIQMMGPLKVSILAERISNTYLRVSKQYIMPPLSEVGHMLGFLTDGTEAAKAQFFAELTRRQESIQKQARTASEGILALVGDDQKQFLATIDNRVTKIQDSLKDVLPAITQPVPKQIEDVTRAHVTEVIKQKEQLAEAVPPHKVEDFI